MKDIKNMNRRTQFEIFKGTVENGKFQKARVAGLAFLREGKLEYKLKVFSQISNRLYVVPDDETSDRYKVLVKDEVQQKYGKPKTYWCEVGEGRILVHLGLMELKVDLWGEPLYMSIFPRTLAVAKPFAKLAELKLVA